MKVVQSFGKDAKNVPLRLTLCDTNAEMADAWLNSFFGITSVEIVQGDLMDAGADAVVSPANSFGDMSGGVDKRIDDYYKGAAQEAITRRIREQYWGELPVGMAVVVSMPDAHPPFVVAAPTMRVPGRVADTLNAYLAMRAVLVAVLQYNADSGSITSHTSKRGTLIRSIAIPGLGTGVGGMAAAVAANQMRTAYDNIIGGGWKDVEHPAMAPLAFGGKNVRWRDAT